MRLGTTQLALIACAGAALVASACGSSDPIETGSPAESPERSAVEQATPSPAEVRPAAIVGQCMQRHGLEVTVGEDRVDFSSLDQSDPAVVAAIESCNQEAEDALRSTATGGSEASAPTEIGQDAFVQAMFGCMESHGYHPQVAEPDPSTEVQGGVIVEYAPGEEQAASFAGDEAACMSEAQGAADSAGTESPG
jgi:hypothetical protein